MAKRQAEGCPLELRLLQQASKRPSLQFDSPTSSGAAGSDDTGFLISEGRCELATATSGGLGDGDGDCPAAARTRAPETRREPQQQQQQPGRGLAFPHAAACEQGGRAYMEDAHASAQLPCGAAAWGVFDGHGGAFVADHCARNLLPRLGAALAGGAAGAAPSVPAALRSAFQSVDQELAARPRREAHACGSTAAVCVVTEEWLYTANCGDSRVVLVRSDLTLPLTIDHAPTRPDEAERIRRAGGEVVWSNGFRVGGALSMTRAIGDHFLRTSGVVAEPEVAAVRRSSADELLLLATDGLWAAVSCGEAAAVARRALARAEAAAMPARAAALVAARALAKLALARGSLDNVCVVVADLRPGRGAAAQGAPAGACGAAAGVPAPAGGAATEVGGTEEEKEEEAEGARQQLPQLLPPPRGRPSSPFAAEELQLPERAALPPLRVRSDPPRRHHTVTSGAVLLLGARAGSESPDAAAGAAAARAAGAHGLGSPTAPLQQHAIPVCRSHSAPALRPAGYTVTTGSPAGRGAASAPTSAARCACCQPMGRAAACACGAAGVRALLAGRTAPVAAAASSGWARASGADGAGPGPLLLPPGAPALP
ncbi:phosphatase 2C [Raphidocelis subcapitata]|uniref:Phosphatase 2C n=1 Tax=Raphidocelis subcapitata TaxID=307507 RepID=A0A2V0P081_9CHLO|nr:phosphatase 2C [Raphidocelis subcapitata]|eukprot:GBF93274.1 phosphatase 2C [Raphidocelis subcapitata]